METPGAGGRHSHPTLGHRKEQAAREEDQCSSLGTGVGPSFNSDEKRRGEEQREELILQVTRVKHWAR